MPNPTKSPVGKKPTGARKIKPRKTRYSPGPKGDDKPTPSPGEEAGYALRAVIASEKIAELTLALVNLSGDLNRTTKWILLAIFLGSLAGSASAVTAWWVILHS